MQVALQCFNTLTSACRNLCASIATEILEVSWCMWSKKNDLFSLNFFFFPLKFHIHNPETFLLYVGFLRGLMAIEQAWRLSGLLADCMWAGKAWTASFKHGLCFASQKLVTKKKKAWSITPINEISQYQRCLEIKERTDPWGYLSYYHQNTGLFLAAFFERQAFKEQSDDFFSSSSLAAETGPHIITGKGQRNSQGPSHCSDPTSRASPVSSAHTQDAPAVKWQRTAQAATAGTWWIFFTASVQF